MITLTTWEESQELIKPVRYQVFVIEQSIPESEEWDDDDARAIHALAIIDDQVVGTGRLIIHGSQAKIGRMAVLKEQREKGIGIKLLNSLIDAAKQAHVKYLYLYAQLHARYFYERLGFKENGPIFDEAGIDHVEMNLFL